MTTNTRPGAYEIPSYQIALAIMKRVLTMKKKKEETK